MARYEGDLDFLRKPYFFTRSMTLHSSPVDPPPKPSLDRSQSIMMLGSSIASVTPSSSSIKGKVKSLCKLFESAKSNQARAKKSQSQDLPKSNLARLDGSDPRFLSCSSKRLPGTEDRIVVFLTSLRGIRRTFEDCYAVKMIFRGFRVWVDERDVSMDGAYRMELQGILEEKQVSLPQVFIKGWYLGGAEAVKQLFEAGELGGLLDGIRVLAPGCFCRCCGDARFVPCGNCSGSRKVFEVGEGVASRCLECNENGLIRCPDCCS